MPSLNWQPHRYGGGESVTLAPGLTLNVELSMVRDNLPPYRWSAWGIRGTARFATCAEAKTAAERWARKALGTGLAALGEAPHPR